MHLNYKFFLSQPLVLHVSCLILSVCQAFFSFLFLCVFLSLRQMERWKDGKISFALSAIQFCNYYSTVLSIMVNVEIGSRYWSCFLGSILAIVFLKFDRILATENLFLKHLKVDTTVALIIC